MPTQGDNLPVPPGFTAVQQIRFLVLTCNRWANSLSNPVRAFRNSQIKMAHQEPNLYKRASGRTFSSNIRFFLEVEEYSHRQKLCKEHVQVS